MTKQEALNWFVANRQLFSLFNDVSSEAEDVAIECIKASIDREKAVSKATGVKAIYKCGSCKNQIESVAHKFCPYCGRKLNWEKVVK